MNIQTEKSAETQEATAGPETASGGNSRKMLWASRIMSALPVLLFAFSAVMKLQRPPALIDGFKHFGLPETLAIPIGVLELACTIVYVIPQTAVLGAILLTGYLGGAILTTLRVGDSWIMAVVVGVLVWGGLFLRDSRVRALIPFRR